MTTTTIPEFVDEVRKLPHGLVLVVGPKKSGKTNTMLLLESAVSKMNRGRYFRIGSKAPKDNSLIRFIETFEPAFGSIEEMDTEQLFAEHSRWMTWERKLKFSIYPSEPAGVFIDGLDYMVAPLAKHAIDMSLTGILAIVSIEADTALEAIEWLSAASEIEASPNSLLHDAIKAVVVQKSSIDPDTGDTVIDAEVIRQGDYALIELMSYAFVGTLPDPGFA